MKQDMRVVKTKTALKKSLLELIKVQTFEKITVSDICKNAYVNRVTFYTHYQDKYELFMDYINDVSKTILELAIKDTKSSTEQGAILDFTISYLNNTLDQINFYRDVLITFGNQENSMLVFMLQKAALKNITEIINNVNGKVKKIRYQPEIVASFLVGGFSQMIFQYLDSGSKLSLETLKRDGAQIIRDGMKADILFY